MSEPVADRLAYPLEQVAEMTGVPLRFLQDGARRQLFDHVRAGRARLMTRPQIEAMLARFTVVVEMSDEQVQLEMLRARVARQRHRRELGLRG